MIWPSFQSTAFNSGPLVSGSITPFWEAPATHSRSFTHQGKLLLVPGSAPKSCKTPCSNLNACCTTQLGLKQLGKYGSGIAVSAPPTTLPPLLITPGSKNSTMLSGPPNVPRSTNLYRACCPAPLVVACSCADAPIGTASAATNANAMRHICF